VSDFGHIVVLLLASACEGAKREQKGHKRGRCEEGGKGAKEESWREDDQKGGRVMSSSATEEDFGRAEVIIIN